MEEGGVEINGGLENLGGVYILDLEKIASFCYKQNLFFFYKTRTTILNTTKYKEVTGFRNYPFFSLLVERCEKLSPGDF